MQAQQHSEVLADKKADRLTYIFALIFIVASWFVLSWTTQTDDNQLHWYRPWVREAASHIGVAIALWVIPILLTRFPLSRPVRIGNVGAYLIGFFAFSCTHLFLMILFRKLLYPALFDTIYVFGIGDIGNWAYEMSKDAYTYGLLLCAFHYGRHLEQLRLEVAAGHDDARTNKLLTLKCGGRTIFIGAGEIIWAKAASNYVEIRTENKTHLARMTLARLKNLLAEAGNAHTQSHRSYIVRRDAVREIIPTGDGDANLILTNGETIPASRGYRKDLGVGN